MSEPPSPDLPNDAQREPSDGERGAGGDAGADRLSDVVDEYVDALLEGKSPDSTAVVGANPDLAPRLDEQLQLVNLLHRVIRAPSTSGLDVSPAGGSAMPPAVPPAAASALPQEATVHFNCPHCGNAIQIVDSGPDEI